MFHMVKFWDKTIIYGSFPTCSVSLAIDLFFAGTPHPINKLLVVTELGWTQMLFQQSRVDDTTCLGTMFGMQLDLKTHYKFIFHVYYILENEIIRISSGVANLLCPDTFNLCPHRQLYCMPQTVWTFNLRPKQLKRIGQDFYCAFRYLVWSGQPFKTA